MIESHGGTRRLRIDLHGTPGPQGSKNSFLHPKTKRIIMVESSKKVKPWRQLVSHAASDAMRVTGLPLAFGVIFAVVHYRLKRPKSHYTSKGELKTNAPKFVKTKPDLSKLQRSTEDAMTGIVYHDDAQIASMTIVKEYGQPGATILIEAEDWETSGT